jgi:hypothetical protein
MQNRICLAPTLVATVLWLTGCVAPTASGSPAPPFRMAGMSAQDALKTIASGTSTKADVLTQLGPANVVRFDSGFEVWVYSPPGAEFVVLFTPSGVVKKTRIRPLPT